MRHHSTNVPIWQQKTYAILAECAGAKATITYLQLAEQAEIPTPHRIHQLTTFLESLIATDAESNRSLRAALVVSKGGEKIPAKGFFDCCQQCGILREDGESDGAFHTRLLAALYDEALTITKR